jgi:hypothetical protein
VREGVYRWETGVLDGNMGWEDIYGYIEYLGGLGLGRIERLVCDRRETTVFAFLGRKYCFLRF